MKNLVASITLAGCLLMAHSASAILAGPYTADAYTLHLWHLDESAVPCIDSVPSGGINLNGLLGGATLGNPAYPGFGTSLNTLGTYGYNVWTTNAAAATTFAGGGLFPTTAATAATANFTYVGANGAFTMEALICPLFPVMTNFGTVAHGGTGRAVSSWQLVTGESATTADRIWQWRFDPIGVIVAAPEPATGNTAPLLDFINVGAGGTTYEIYAPVPTTGPNAIASNQWFHVAVTYNGVPNTPGNFNFYWTAMNATNTAANLILSTNLPSSLTQKESPSFAIGNSGRSDNGNWLGAIDEVRMSSVARGASGMMFALPNVTVTPIPNQFAPVGSTVNLTSLASGGLPITYQWQFNGTNINGATFTNISGINTNSLVISNITFAQSGVYTMIAANANSSNSVSATITVGSPVAGLFNTGLTASGALQAGGLPDANWLLAQSADPTLTGPAAIVDSSIPTTYIPDGPNSQWISPGDNASVAGGYYEYATSFYLDSENTTNMQLTVNWAADNVCVDIFVNGVDQNLTNGNGFTAFAPNVLSNNFVPGSNNLICVISNLPGTGPNLSAFRAELSAISALQPPTAIQVLSAPTNFTAYQYQNATFAVSAYGSGPLGYQWYFGASLLTGQTGRSLILTDVDPSQSGNYSVVISNTVSTNTQTATLNVVEPDTLEWFGYLTADWDITTTNWYDLTALAEAPFSQNANVLFDNSGSSQPNVSLDLPLTPNSVTVSANNNYTFAGSGYLAGNFNLNVDGPGTLTIDTAAPNTYTGNTIIQGGAIQLGNGDGNGTLGSSSVSNNGALIFTTPNATTFPNQLSGSGTVAMNGSGTELLTGFNSGFVGSMIVSNGTLTPRSAAAFGSAGVTVLDNAQLYLDENLNFPATPMTLGGVGLPANPNGALHKGGAGSSALGGPIILTDSAGIGLDASSTLLLTNPAAITGAGIPLAFQFGASAAATVSGAINLGSGSFTLYGPATGAGTAVLTSLGNVWTGGSTIYAGCLLQIGDGANDGSIGQGPISDAGTLTFLTANSFTETNPISGAGVFNQSGAGRIVFSGDPLSGFSGAIHINGNGQIQLANGDSLTSGSLTIGAAQADTNRLELTGNNTVSLPITIFPRAFTGTITASPVTPATNYPDIVNLSGTNTVSPSSPIVIPTGGNLFCLECDSGYLIYNAGVTSAGGGRDFALQGPGSGEVDGPLTQGAGDSLNIYMVGSGTWYLNGQSSTTGATIVSNGVLVINGTMASSPVSAYGGTLGGTGTLTGPVVIGAGGILAPTLATGSALGALTVNNTLTLQPGSVTAMQINKTALASDQVTGLTSVTLGGALSVTNLSGALAAGDSFQLFNAASYAGSFSSIIPATPGPGLHWDLSGVSVGGALRVLGASSSSPSIATSAVANGSLTLTGSGGTVGDTYILLTSTNIGAPLSRWTTVTNGAYDGSGNFSVTITAPTATPSFYVLESQ